jgi:hypothetical protein
MVRRMVVLFMSVRIVVSISSNLLGVMPEFALAVARDMLINGHYNYPKGCLKFLIAIW